MNICIWKVPTRLLHQVHKYFPPQYCIQYGKFGKLNFFHKKMWIYLSHNHLHKLIEASAVFVSCIPPGLLLHCYTAVVADDDATATATAKAEIIKCTQNRLKIEFTTICFFLCNLQFRLWCPYHLQSPSGLNNKLFKSF